MGLSRRILTTAVLLWAVALVDGVHGAAAAPPGVPGVWSQLAGSAEGTQVADFDPACPASPFPIRHEFDLTVAGGPAAGAVDIAVDMCVSFVEQVAFFDGTFVLHARLGDISGGASGSVTEVIPPEVRSVFTLTPTSGTRALRSHLVPLTLELTWGSPGPGVVAPAEGTLNVGPSQPGL